MPWYLLFFFLMLYFAVVVLFFGCPAAYGVPSPGIRSERSCNLCCNCSNARSFNPLCRAGDQTASWRYSDAADPIHCTTAGTAYSWYCLFVSSLFSFSLFFLVNMARGSSILLIFLKNQFSISWIFLFCFQLFSAFMFPFCLLSAYFCSSLCTFPR